VAPTNAAEQEGPARIAARSCMVAEKRVVGTAEHSVEGGFAGQRDVARERRFGSARDRRRRRQRTRGYRCGGDWCRRIGVGRGVRAGWSIWRLERCRGRAVAQPRGERRRGVRCAGRRGTTIRGSRHEGAVAGRSSRTSAMSGSSQPSTSTVHGGQAACSSDQSLRRSGSACHAQGLGIGGRAPRAACGVARSAGAGWPAASRPLGEHGAAELDCPPE
jgi:hypothetical protein